MAAFPKDTLVALAERGEGKEINGLRVVEDDIVDQGRWTTWYRMVFTDGARFYQARYGVGSTENQDEAPFEYDPDPIECVEVFPVERVVTFYEPAPV